VVAEVDHLARHATMRNHTATHLLHAALREVLGVHVRQAGSAVRPDKLRFDFTHGAPLSAEEIERVSELVNGWIKQSRPVRALHMSRAEAERLGAMALFGEKYGDWVRVIEVDQVSRELCGGTHVANTAEVGIFAIASEGSSAANVRRIEALTGPAAIDFFQEQSRRLAEVGRLLGAEQDPVGGAQRARERLKELERRARRTGQEELGKLTEELVASGDEVAGISVVAARAPGADQKMLLRLADQVRQRAGEAAVVLGGADDGKVAMVATFSEGAIERGLSAAEVIREAAKLVGGGGGGRENVAQAGGREPEKLDQALSTARDRIEQTLRE